jgi:hypothetical protein
MRIHDPEREKSRENSQVRFAIFPGGTIQRIV